MVDIASFFLIINLDVVSVMRADGGHSYINYKYLNTNIRVFNILHQINLQKTYTR